MNIYITLYVIVFSFLPLVLKGQSTDLKTMLETNYQEDRLTIQAKIINNSDLIHDLNYLLVGIKQSKSGNLSNNKQEGKFVINPDETQLLSTLSINIEKEDLLKVYLFIRNEDKNELVTKDSIFVNVDNNANIFKSNLSQNPIQNSQEPEIKEEDFILSGIVLDQTKSKVGKDFYDYFYSRYSLLSEKYPFIITISELPSLGRNGIINIEVGDKVVHTFRTMPKEDYLTAQVDFTLRQINGYNRQNKLIEKELNPLN